jgi:hypothetical protein
VGVLAASLCLTACVSPATPVADARSPALGMPQGPPQTAIEPVADRVAEATTAIYRTLAYLDADDECRSDVDCDEGIEVCQPQDSERWTCESYFPPPCG